MHVSVIAVEDGQGTAQRRDDDAFAAVGAFEYLAVEIQGDAALDDQVAGDVPHQPGAEGGGVADLALHRGQILLREDLVGGFRRAETDDLRAGETAVEGAACDGTAVIGHRGVEDAAGDGAAAVEHGAVEGARDDVAPDGVIHRALKDAAGEIAVIAYAAPDHAVRHVEGRAAGGDAHGVAAGGAASLAVADGAAGHGEAGVTAAGHIHAGAGCLAQIGFFIGGAAPDAAAGHAEGGVVGVYAAAVADGAIRRAAHDVSAVHSKAPQRSAGLVRDIDAAAVLGLAAGDDAALHLRDVLPGGILRRQGPQVLGGVKLVDGFGGAVLQHQPDSGLYPYDAAAAVAPEYLAVEVQGNVGGDEQGPGEVDVRHQAHRSAAGNGGLQLLRRADLGGRAGLGRALACQGHRGQQAQQHAQGQK